MFVLITINGNAKINLTLDILGKREDGYHEVAMVMQSVGLHDTLEMEKTSGEILLELDVPGLEADERNLAWKAADLVIRRFHPGGGVHIRLTKRIPIAAGLAGGSTDCAAAIKAVNEIFGLKLSEKEMMEIGVKLGADVPFCIMARTALSEGIGEKLSDVKKLPKCHVLVAKPPISVSTGMVYKNLKCDELKKHPDVDGMIEALSNEDLNKTATCMENVLETVTVKLYPKIEELKNIMKEQGALNAIMSGSGPTVFGLFTSEETANEVKKYIADKGLSNEVYVVKPV